MNHLVKFSGEVLTMSSLEIAELTGKRHPDVKRDVESMLSALGIDVSSFAHIYRDSQNRKQDEYKLPKDLTLTLVTGYDVKRRHAINRRTLDSNYRGGEAPPPCKATDLHGSQVRCLTAPTALATRSHGRHSAA